MKKKAVLFALFATLVTSVAQGGYEQPAELIIERIEPLGVTSARGDLATVRFSDDDEAFIGCGVRTTSTPGGTLTWAFCHAGSSDHDTLLCTTFDPEMIAKLEHLNDTSFLGFWVNDDGECVRIATSTHSFYLLSGKQTKK